MKFLSADKTRKLNELLYFRKRFGTLEYRIILLALLQMTWDNEQTKMYPIYIQNVFFEDVEYNYELFKNAVFSLHSYEIDFQDGTQYSIITKSSGNNNNESIIEIRFHDSVQKFLLSLKTKNPLITFYNAIFLKEEFSIKLYEVLKGFKSEGIANLDFQDLKDVYLSDDQEIVNAMPKEDDAQAIPNRIPQPEFDISIIQNATDSINGQCDLFVTFEVLDDGKIHFTIKNNEYFLDGRYLEYREINERITKKMKKVNRLCL